jgi:hypothetical protein
MQAPDPFPAVLTSNAGFPAGVGNGFGDVEELSLHAVNNPKIAATHATRRRDCFITRVPPDD